MCPQKTDSLPNAFQEILSQRNLRHRLQFGRTWRLVWQSAPGWTVINGVFVLIEGLLPLLALYLLKLIVDAFAEGLSQGTPQAFSHATWLIVALAGVTAVAAVFKSFRRLVAEAHAEAVNDHVQTIIQAKAVEVDLQDYESPEYHDLLQQVQTQGTFRPARIAREMFTGLRSLITCVSLAAFLLSFSWVLGAILILFAVPGVMVRLKFAHRLIEWLGKHSSLQRFSSYLNAVLAGSGHAKEVRLFGLGEVLQQRARHWRKKMRTARVRLESRRALLELIPNLSAVIALFLSFWVVARQAMKGLLSLGDIVVYYQSFQRCQRALSEFLNALVNFYEDSLFLSIFFRFLDLRPHLASPKNPRPVPHDLKAGLELENVTFRYPGTTRDVLSNLSLAIDPGEVIALVGENGAGKTTLAKLICRLYDPIQGRILLDGIDIREFAPAEYRRRIGVLFQDFNQYNLTARENIWFGDVSLDPEDPGIAASAAKAGIHETISGLGNGYDTILGREFRAGEQLSTGQWQRVALSRALFRNAQIMILDEPTSAMDPKAECEMYQAIQNMTEGRTTLLISHRLSTVTMADRICLLEKGCIAEMGSHGELQACRGRYAHLFERQSRAYR